MITPLDILSIETWILLISGLVLIRLYIHKKWQFLKNLNIPHNPPSILGFGNMKEMLASPGAVFKYDSILKKKYGSVYGSYMWLSPRITIADPEILKQIFIKEFPNFRDRQRMFTKIGGAEMNTALTAASGEQWKRIRNTMSPTFSTSKMKEMVCIIDGCTDQMIDNLRKVSGNENGRFSPKETFGKLSMDVICSAAFSINVHSQDENATKTVEMAKRFFDQTFFSNPLIIIFMLFPWTEKIAEKCNYSAFDTKALNYYRRLVDNLIENKSSNTKQRVDIMQQLMKNEIKEDDVKQGAEKGVTRNEIVGNSILMILGGYETTANTMLFFAYCVATWKEAQKKIQDEIDEAIEKYGGLTYEAINDMKYLEMCMHESQRMYGVVPRNSRFCEKDITINGMHIPAGIHVDVPTHALAHDEEYWDEPWEYKPERFEDMSKIDPMVFQPFGAGPRNCIGMRFAIIELKMAIAKILLNFNLDVCEDTPPHPLQLSMKASVKPEKEVFLRIISKDTSVA